MSGLPFNPMRKSPPPPPHIDTVSFNASEYIIVRSSDGQEFFVHRDCLDESPFLRRTFAMGQDIEEDSIIVSFSASEPGSRDDSASAVTDALFDRRFSADMSAANDEGPTADEATTGSPTQPTGDGNTLRGRHAGARSASLPFEAAGIQTEGTAESAADAPAVNLFLRKSNAPPLVLKETLHVNPIITVRFPATNAANVETVIAYLHYKHRYERKVEEPRPPFELPVGAAIAVMKMAQLLEC